MVFPFHSDFLPSYVAYIIYFICFKFCSAQVIGERMERLEQQTFLKKSTYLKSLEEAKVKAQEASKQLDNGLSLLDQKRKHVNIFEIVLLNGY